MTLAWWNPLDYYVVTNFLWGLFVMGCLAGIVVLAFWEPSHRLERRRCLDCKTPILEPRLLCSTCQAHGRIFT